MKKRKDGIIPLSNGKFQATVWFVDARGKRVKKEKTFPTKSIAREWRNSFKTDLIRGEAHITASRLTVEEFFEEVIKQRESRLRMKWPHDDDAKIKRRLSHDRAVVKVLKQATGATRRVSKLTVADIEKHISLRRAEGRHPKTINHDLAFLRHSFKLAPLLFRELRNWQPPQIRMLPVSARGRERTLTFDEEARIYTALGYYHQDFADFFLVAIDTAMRMQEILNLKPLNVRFDHPRFAETGAIEVIATKVDRSKVIPMSEGVRDIMKRRVSQAKPDSYIFPFDGVSRIAAQIRVERAMKTISQELQIPYGRFTAGGWIVHDLRRTAINRMLQRSDYDYKTVEAIAGLSIEVMLQSYAKPHDDRMVRAITREKGVENFVE